MKNVFILFVIIFFNKSNAQNFQKDFFIFQNKKIDYLFTNGNKVGEFNVVVISKNASNDSLFFLNKLKKCIQKNNSKYYPSFLLILPQNNKILKEELVLDFINSILVKRKLVDHKLNVFANENYFNLYKQTRENLLKIRQKKYNLKKLIILEQNYKIKDSLKSVLEKLNNYLEKYSALNTINRMIVFKKNDIGCYNY